VIVDVPLTRYHVPSVLLVALGIAVIALGVQATDPLQNEYTYHVERTGDPGPGSDREVRRFADLSDRGKAAFREALESPDDHASVTEFYWQSRKPPDFDHSSEIPVSNYVRYEGQYYAVYASEPWGPHFSDVAFGIVFLVGGTASLIGARSVRHDRPRTPLTILVGIAAMAAVWTGLGISGSNFEYRVPQYYLWSVPVAGIVGMAVTWRALTERWRPESGQTA